MGRRGPTDSEEEETRQGQWGDPEPLSPAHGPPYMISLLRRGPPKGTKGRLPVAAWYRVTPMLQRSTVTPNAFCWGFRSTARSYMSGCCQREPESGHDREAGQGPERAPRSTARTRPLPPAGPLPLPPVTTEPSESILLVIKHWHRVGLCGALSFVHPLPWGRW